MKRSGKFSTGSYIGQLRGSRNPYARLSDLRTEVAISALPALARWYPNLVAAEPLLVQGRFPTTVKGIRATRFVMKPVSLEREAIWAAHFLSNYAVKLNRFLELRARLDPLLLNGTYDECIAVLEEIENSVSHSLWSIEFRFALISLWKGPEGQKAYTSAILDSEVRNFVHLFVSNITQRNEESSDPFRFRSFFHASVEQWQVQPAFKAYVLYRIADEWQDTAGTVSSILRIEAISPVIDYYETFIRLATRAIARSSPLALQFHQPVKILADVVRDSRLERLMTFVDARVQTALGGAPPLDSIKLLDRFVAGACGQVVTDIRLMAPAERDEMALRIAGRCYAETGESIGAEHSLFGRLLGLCTRLIAKDEGIDGPFTGLMRLALNFRFATFATGLQEFALRQLSSAPLPERREICTRFIETRYLDVAAIPYLPDWIQFRLAEYIRSRFPDSIGVASELARLDLPDQHFAVPEGLSREVACEIELESSFRRGDDSRVLALAESAYTFGGIRFRRFAARLHSNSLLRLDQFEQAVDLIVDTYLADIGAVRMLPLRECIDRMSKATRRRLAGKLAMPILLDLFVRNVDDRQRELREFTYEDFLLAHSLQRPSELGRIANNFDPKQLIYYLRFVCVPEVMQVSPTFQNSHSLEDERLLVCTLLTALDKPNAKIYEREIDEITRRQLIQHGVRQVEQSKISIDLEPLRRWARRNLNDSFVRIKTLEHAGIESGTKDNATSANLHSALNEQELPEVSVESAANLLLTMITSLLSECFLNPRHGLDCYLSMRVRHGALSGQLRAALEDEKIITQRKGGSDEYARNDYWLSRLNLSHGVAIQLDARLRQFAGDYDELIREFAANKVQIKSSDKPDALFADSVPKTSIELLAHDFHPETTFDRFLDLCFDTFSQTVENSLESVRNYIDNTLKPQVNALFVSLLADSEKITEGIPTPLFDTAVRTAQTRTQQALDVVKDWFRQVNPPPPRSFFFEEMVHIGLQQVKKRSFGFDPILQCDIAEMPEFANLARFSDIFVILFENVARHSGMIEHPRVTIRAWIDGPFLKVSFENTVSSDIEMNVALAKLTRIQTIIGEGGLHSGIRSEGGTGLIKLSNIVGGDRTASKLVFGFREQGIFYVHIQLPMKEVELDVLEGDRYESATSRG